MFIFLVHVVPTSWNELIVFFCFRAGANLSFSSFLSLCRCPPVYVVPTSWNQLIIDFLFFRAGLGLVIFVIPVIVPMSSSIRRADVLELIHHSFYFRAGLGLVIFVILVIPLPCTRKS